MPSEVAINSSRQPSQSSGRSTRSQSTSTSIKKAHSETSSSRDEKRTSNIAQIDGGLKMEVQHLQSARSREGSLQSYSSLVNNDSPSRTLQESSQDYELRGSAHAERDYADLQDAEDDESTSSSQDWQSLPSHVDVGSPSLTLPTGAYVEDNKIETSFRTGESESERNFYNRE